jgi:glycosyltransferase involved in cell wall biosynthesis
MLPVALVFVPVYALLKLISYFGKKSKFGAIKAVKRIIKYYSRINSVGNNVYSYIYNIINDQVQKDLVYRINKSEKHDVWYSPSIFWEQFNNINSTKVINVPDLVTEEFPIQWGGHNDIVMSSKICEKTIEGGQNFITYSQYVKDTLLIDKYGKEESNIIVINHNINDLSNYITINSEITKNLASEDVFTTAYCQTIMQTLAPHTSQITPYIRNFDFKDVKFIFYASQARPHKNLLNLIKAYELMLRRNYIRVKLFLTCNLESDPEVLSYIREKRLQYDIISFYNISSKQLAALYHQAQLVVNPTLYEGGFPFTFGEGMSVGTPSVMSRIPQVEEFTRLYKLEECLFDPYNYKDIAEKIIYGLGNLEKLKEKQLALYNYLYKNFSQEEVGKKYENSFKTFIKADCYDDNIFSNNSNIN